MCWYNQPYIRLLFILNIIIFISGLQSCRPDIKVTHPNFFDIKGFFEADSAKLMHLDPIVKKTVSHNGKAETKSLHIKNWGSELGLFINSDINKPAWRDGYTIVENDTLLHYTAKQPDLKVRDISVTKQGGKVKSISITNHTENFLYTNTEKLYYWPDSVYRIEKTQHVRFIGDNRYKIQGILLK
ncbi:MAG: hypothetical protein EOP46_18155 [Sphingobacteriaceae bacterium]|nr:MAG: hypothetical protein EOP46_18155 [Sphingobacteriaceae bacterium]